MKPHPTPPNLGVVDPRSKKHEQSVWECHPLDERGVVVEQNVNKPHPFLIKTALHKGWAWLLSGCVHLFPSQVDFSKGAIAQSDLIGVDKALVGD